MNFTDIVRKTRSYRRFDESYRIGYETLQSLVGLARLSSTGANRQPLKFMIFHSPEECEKIFPCLVWAAYLKDWHGPGEGERPSAYIMILGDTSIAGSFGVDHGIAAQTMMLGATEAGLGGCMIASIMREDLRNEIKLPDKYEILLVLAIGKPVEKVIIEDIKDDDVKYWRDSNNNHHVPKRSLEELIITLKK